jgi:hypothetical protein
MTSQLLDVTENFFSLGCGFRDFGLQPLHTVEIPVKDCVIPPGVKVEKLVSNYP